MKRKGFFSRLADRLFGVIRKPRRKTPKQTLPDTPGWHGPGAAKRKQPKPPPVEAPRKVATPGYVNYTLAGWRTLGNEWQDVEAGADLPKNKGGKWDGWRHIDLVTVNLAPDTEEGFYRSANVFLGFDEYPEKPAYDFYDEDPAYTLDNLAYELALEYGFAVQ